MTSLERFICERENLVLDSLIYFERFQKRSNVMEFRSFGDITSSRMMCSLCTFV